MNNSNRVWFPVMKRWKCFLIYNALGAQIFKTTDTIIDYDLNIWKIMEVKINLKKANGYYFLDMCKNNAGYQ